MQWAWGWKLAAFVALFLSSGFALSFASAVLFGDGAGAPPPAGVASWLLLASALFATWALAAGMEKRPVSSVGLRWGRAAAAEAAWGLLAGIVAIGTVLLAFAALGWVVAANSESAASQASEYSFTQASLPLFIAPAAFGEELLCRGYPFQLLRSRFGPVAAVVATSTAFGLLHIANPGITWLAVTNLILAGVLLGVAYWRTGSLWFVAALHAGWNWMMAAPGFSVSGLDMGTRGLDFAPSAPALLTGGDFGPEGGLLVSLATVAGTAAVWHAGRLPGLSRPAEPPGSPTRGRRRSTARESGPRPPDTPPLP